MEATWRSPTLCGNDVATIVISPGAKWILSNIVQEIWLGSSQSAVGVRLVSNGNVFRPKQFLKMQHYIVTLDASWRFMNETCKSGSERYPDTLTHERPVTDSLTVGYWVSRIIGDLNNRSYVSGRSWLSFIGDVIPGMLLTQERLENVRWHVTNLRLPEDGLLTLDMLQSVRSQVTNL